MSAHYIVTINPPLQPGQAEALVEQAVPLLREILQAWRRRQAEESIVAQTAAASAQCATPSGGPGAGGMAPAILRR